MNARLEAYKDTMPRRERSNLEKEIDREEVFVTELDSFKGTLHRVAALGYAPDLDDGDVLNIAPFHEVVPWKEAKAYWEKLCAGQYTWSAISQRLRAKDGVER